MSSTARLKEAAMLDRCVLAASSVQAQLVDDVEANVMRVAALVLKSRFPAESARLMQASLRFFKQHQNSQPLTAEQVLRKGWITSLPRLRDMLTEQLRRA
jgi:hypothetical protein